MCWHCVLNTDKWKLCPHYWSIDTVSFTAAVLTLCPHYWCVDTVSSILVSGHMVYCPKYTILGTLEFFKAQKFHARILSRFFETELSCLDFTPKLMHQTSTLNTCDWTMVHCWYQHLEAATFLVGFTQLVFFKTGVSWSQISWLEFDIPHSKYGIPSGFKWTQASHLPPIDSPFWG